MLKDLDNIAGAKITRRSFVKGTVAAGAAATLYGCSKNGTDVYYGSGDGGTVVVPDPVETESFYGVTGHNCGGRCISVAQVQGGRIVRILNDEGEYSHDGAYLDPDSRNLPNTRSCTKCRAYRYRIYHSGRLRYPLKQTRKRGDLSGFVRITWDQAITEIATKHKAVYDTYGVDGIYQIYAAGASAGTFNTAGGAFNSFALPLIGGTKTSYWASYSTHQWWFAQNGLTGADAIRGNHSNNLATYANAVVMWGDNTLTTSNPAAYSTVKSIEDMKNRVRTKAGYDEKFDGRVVYVGPEFSDTGVICADEWLPSKPYTDAALVAGMVYHMLDNTFNLSTGQLQPNPWLDVNYLDTMVYGFFDSPPYNLDETSGTISAAPATAPAGTRNIDAVPKGQSYCSWVLGNKSGPAYSNAAIDANYTADSYATIDSSYNRWAPCSFSSSVANSGYKTKQDFAVPKDPDWAEKITGVSAEKIKYLAELFCKHGPVFVRWSGGFQKQAEGIANFFAAQALHVITKNVGHEGSIFTWGPFSGATTTGAAAPVPTTFTILNSANLPEKPVASCTAWHAVIKNTYYNELQAGGYTGKYIPNYGTVGKDKAYWDDGGVKGFVKWERNAATNKVNELAADGDGDVFYEWSKDASGNPIYAGIRLMYNGGGNIFMNQHENTNDSREMLESLPLNNYTDSDSFCLVSVDNFLSPTPRWSDYVLPGTTYWEQPEVMGPTNSNYFYMSPAATPPGESKQLFDIGRLIVKKFRQMGWETLLDSDPAGVVITTTAGGTLGKTTAKAYIEEDATIEDIVRTYYNENKSSVSALADVSWEEYKKKPILRKRADDFTVLKPYRKEIMAEYQKFVDAGTLKTSPFIKVAETGGTYLSTNHTRHVLNYEVDTMCNAPGANGPYGVQYANDSTAPKSPLRMQVHQPVMLWNYAHRFDKWHGYLKADGKSVGQNKTDIEGDPLVYGIPLYYAWEDYFMEAYGDGVSLNTTVKTDYPFMLTTTHNRHRAHSSMVENPLLRELSHNTPGKDAQGLNVKGNDYTFYATAPEQAFQTGSGGQYPELSTVINNNTTKAEIVDAANKGLATFMPLMMNETDGKALNLENGDLIEVRNPIGIVYCVAKLTKRCAPGFVSLHQGSWYDPRTIDGEVVDVGGCCNTLMASQPSRIDHGNAEQSALVKITKIEY